MRALLAFFLLSAAAAPAAADTALRRHLEREVRREGCTLVRFEAPFRGILPGDPRPVVAASYSFEGCGGGNNWTATFGVFAVEGGGFRRLPEDRSAPSRPDVVERVRVADGRITVEGLSYGPDDGRCCPSLRRQAAYALRDGRVVPAR